MKILIVQTGKIGDMILTTPMFRRIKEKYPDSILHVLASGRNYQIIEGHSDIDRIFVLKKNIFHLFYIILKLRKEKYDYWIDPKDHFSNESRILVKFSNSKNKTGYNHKNRYFNQSMNGQDGNFNLHVVERNLMALKIISIKYQGTMKPVLCIDEFSKRKAKPYLSLGNQKIILINISAGEITRYWKPENWSKVINHLKSAGYHVVLSFVEKDKVMAENIRLLTDKLIFFRSGNLKELVSLISMVDLVISPDTSIIHIASAFNKPVIGLYPFEEWNYIKFAPLSDSFRVIRATESDDYSSILPAQVIEKIDEIMSPNSNGAVNE